MLIVVDVLTTKIIIKDEKEMGVIIKNEALCLKGSFLQFMVPKDQKKKDQTFFIASTTSVVGE